MAGVDAAIRARARRSTSGDFATLGADVLGDAHGRASLRLRLRADAAARALRQGRSRDDLVFRAARADRRRPRDPAERPAASSRTARGRGGAEQLPGPLRDPPPVDRADRVREPAARKVWGGPPPESRSNRGSRRPGSARRSAWRSRRAVRSSWPSVVQHDIPEIRLTAGKPTEAPPPPAVAAGSAAPSKAGSAAPAAPPIDRPAAAPRSGCGCASSDRAAGSAARSCWSPARWRLVAGGGEGGQRAGPGTPPVIGRPGAPAKRWKSDRPHRGL